MKLNKIETWFIVIGVICVGLVMFGFTSLVSQHFNSTTGVYYWSFDVNTYINGINTNIKSVTQVFDQDLNLSAHTKWTSCSDLASFFPACADWFKSIANIAIWAIQLIIILPFKVVSVFLAIGTGIVGISLEGSSWNWLYDLIDSISHLSLQYIAFA